MPSWKYTSGGQYPVEYLATPKELERVRKLNGLDSYRDGVFTRLCLHCRHEFTARSPFLFLCMTCKAYFQSFYDNMQTRNVPRGKRRGRDSWEFERRRFLRNLKQSIDTIGLAPKDASIR